MQIPNRLVTMNTITLAGRVLTAPFLSPETQTNKNPLLKLSVDDQHSWTRKEDNIAKGKSFSHDVVVWGPLATQYASEISKGDVVLITGRLEYLKFNDERRGEVKKAQINARQIDVLSKSDI